MSILEHLTLKIIVTLMVVISGENIQRNVYKKATQETFFNGKSDFN